MSSAFFGVSALLFSASWTTTIVWCASMSSMGGMAMPGGWTMSMAWMRMGGQTWAGAAASFLGMWIVMMVAMMLPSLIPMLSRYRESVGRAGENSPPQPRRGGAKRRGGVDQGTDFLEQHHPCRGYASAFPSSTEEGSSQTRFGLLTALVGVGYFFVWTLFGMAAFPIGVALAAQEMAHPPVSRAVPIAVGLVVLVAGLLQFTAWKVRHLSCCVETPVHGRKLPADAGTAWRHGLRLGLDCCQCCAGLMAILLVLGVMDLRVMAAVTAAITMERFAPASERVMRAIGAVAVVAGLFLIARA